MLLRDKSQSALARFRRRLRGSLRDFRRNTTGGVAAVVTIVSPVLIGAMGLGGEAGYWYLTQREVQNAADVAAHATAQQLSAGATQAELQTLAEYLVGNASVELENADVGLFNPPSTGLYIEDGAAIEVTVTETVPRMFSAIYSSDPVQISARAVATAQSGGTGCVLALNDGTDDQGIDISGGVFLTTIMCDVVSNETTTDAVEIHPGTTVMTNCVQTTGTAALNGSVTQTCGAARENTAPMGDPFATIAEPTAVGACQARNVSNTLVTPIDTHPSGMSSVRYCNGLELSGAVTLSPGLYIIEGGDLIIKNGAVVTGAGVMLYLAANTQANVETGATLMLSPPGTGTYAGMTFFSSRATTGRTHTIAGGWGSTFDGAIYAPSSRLQFQGNVSTPFTGCSQIVADDIMFGNFAVMTLHCLFPVGPVASSAGTVAIVE